MKSSIHNDAYLDKKNNVHYIPKHEDNKILETESNKETSGRENKRSSYNQYKGVHYKKEKQVRYFEHGAHFKYQELHDILNSLIKVEAETNCETANMTNSNNTKIKFDNDEHSMKFNKSNLKNDPQLKEISNKSGYQQFELSKDQPKSKTQSSLQFYNNYNAEKTNTLLIRDEENSNNTGQVNSNNMYSHISSKIKQTFNSGAEKEKEKKATILPPINQKIQNLEYVTSKIDTGLKSFAPIKKGKYKR